MLLLLLNLSTSPLDMAKLRLQVQRSTDLMFGYKHMVHGLGLIREKEGLLGRRKAAHNLNYSESFSSGLWKGAGARVMGKKNMSTLNSNYTMKLGCVRGAVLGRYYLHVRLHQAGRKVRGSFVKCTHILVKKSACTIGVYSCIDDYECFLCQTVLGA